MSRVCAVCNKGNMSGNKVSHSNRKTRRNWSANVQKVSYKVGDAVVSNYVCTSCMKHGKIERV